MNGRGDNRWYLSIGILLLLLLLSGCAAREPLYLQPGRGVGNPEASGQPLVQLEPFVEDFGAERVIGGHFFHAERQTLKVREKEIAATLRRLVGQELTERKIPFVYGEQWNGTIEGLDRIDPPVQLVVDGRISRVWLEVKTGVTHSNYAIGLDIGCRMGVVAEQKLISRSVHVAEEMLKFSSQPEEMEKMLNQSLAEAARQIAMKIAENVTGGTGY